ncbi:MAG: C39 family peptidase [bacterium]
MKKKMFFILSFCLINVLNSKVILNKSIKKKRISNKITNVNLALKTYNFSNFYSNIIDLSSANKDSYIWQENHINKFTELILSWNILRPEDGKYSFFISVKNNNNWSNWSKIAEWAFDGQKTFANTNNRFVHTKHVRMEMQNKRMGDGFRVKVLARNGADIKNLKALSVSACDMNKFVFDENRFDNKSIIIKGVPKVSQWNVKHQRAKDFCSPTSMSMILGYYSKKGLLNNLDNNLTEYVESIATKIHDDSYLDIYGAWPLNVAQAFDSSNGKLFCAVKRLNGISDLYGYLVRRIPVAVSVRGYLRGGFKRYDNGHFIVVVGWDNKRKSLLCIDPAFITEKKMLRAYNLKDFGRAWGTSRNLAYIMVPKHFVE